jgi:hypothetical protein
MRTVVKPFGCLFLHFLFPVRIHQLKAVFYKQFIAAHFLAEAGAVKVERSRARGHVASNTLTAPAGAIPSRRVNCL